MVFSFPSTGLWKISCFSKCSDTSAGCIIELSTDSGSNFTKSLVLLKTVTAMQVVIQILVNCTNTSTHQVRIRALALDTNSVISGHASRLDTNVIFERITESQ